MAKRGTANGDESQDELDFDRTVDGEGTIDAPADAASSEPEWPRLGKRPELNDRGRAEGNIPHAALPSLTLNPAWDSVADMPSGAGGTMRSFRMRRIAALAATVALSAALGAVAGSTLTTGLLSHSLAAGRTESEGSVQMVLATVQQDMSALRTAVEKSARDTQTKTARIAERLDRNEKAQAEPLAKLARISDAVERLERRGAPTVAAAATPAQAGDITGLVGGPRVAAPETKPATPNIVSGWKLHDVQDGIAVIEGNAGLVEVWPGDSLPKLGRIEAIRKQDGRWVVVTSRGLIVGR